LLRIKGTGNGPKTGAGSAAKDDYLHNFSLREI